MACQGDWAYVHWASDLPTAKGLHINHKETLAVILAAYRWAHTWRNAKIRVFTDNVTVNAAINKGYSKHSQLVNNALRELFWLSICFNFQIEAHFVPGIENTLADYISRLVMPTYLKRLLATLSLAHSAPSFIADIPQHVYPKALSLIFPQVDIPCPWKPP